ncbi:MAG: hypothetical protein ACLQM8_27720 [Limisphaerales bacterium]
MAPDDARAFSAIVDVCDFFLEQHALHVKFVQISLLRFDELVKVMKCCVQLLDVPDGPQKKLLADEVLSLAERLCDPKESKSVIDGLAHAESDHEKIEALLTTIRASLLP